MIWADEADERAADTQKKPAGTADAKALRQRLLRILFLAATIGATVLSAIAEMGWD